MVTGWLPGFVSTMMLIINFLCQLRLWFSV